MSRLSEKDDAAATEDAGVRGLPGERVWWQARCRQCTNTWHEKAAHWRQVEMCWTCGSMNLDVSEAR